MFFFSVSVFLWFSRSAGEPRGIWEAVQRVSCPGPSKGGRGSVPLPAPDHHHERFSKLDLRARVQQRHARLQQHYGPYCIPAHLQHRWTHVHAHTQAHKRIPQAMIKATCFFSERGCGGVIQTSSSGVFERWFLQAGLHRGLHLCRIFHPSHCLLPPKEKGIPSLYKPGPKCHMGILLRVQNLFWTIC